MTATTLIPNDLALQIAGFGLVDSIREPALSDALKDLTRRAKLAAKYGQSTDATESARALLIGSRHSWGEKEVWRLVKAGRNDEADALRGDLAKLTGLIKVMGEIKGLRKEIEALSDRVAALEVTQPWEVTP